MTSTQQFIQKYKNQALQYFNMLTLKRKNDGIFTIIMGNKYTFRVLDNGLEYNPNNVCQVLLKDIVMCIRLYTLALILETVKNNEEYKTFLNDWNGQTNRNEFYQKSSEVISGINGYLREYIGEESLIDQYEHECLLFFNQRNTNLTFKFYDEMDKGEELISFDDLIHVEVEYPKQIPISDEFETHYFGKYLSATQNEIQRQEFWKEHMKALPNINPNYPLDDGVVVMKDEKVIEEKYMGTAMEWFAERVNLYIH
jgi:hypothetical protein